jgi:xylose isomerase
VKKALEVTQRLGGENYVLWGGREGYETLLNTDMKRELDQMGRFMNMVVEHKHKIGFKGPLLIEPKPREPTKHQYDYDSATVDAFFQRYGLSPSDFRVNIEANHATLAGHSFEHEVAYALASAGTPTSSATTSPSCLWSWRASWRPAASPPAASTSTPRCGARATIRRICSTATSVAWTTWRARC